MSLEGHSFLARTDDAVPLSGTRFEGPRDVAFVVGHGFCGSRNNVLPLAEKLMSRGTVYAFDFRGHGTSAGETTLGYLEALDVKAVVELARRECGPTTHVVTIGASMGGIAVLREAADFATSNAVVSISAPAEWMGQRRRARVLGMLVKSAAGRALAKKYFNTRVFPMWMSPPPPVELVAKIDIPMLILHGEDDPFVNASQAKALGEAAGKRAWVRIISHYGHAEAGFDPRIVDLIDQEIEMMGLLPTL